MEKDAPTSAPNQSGAQPPAGERPGHAVAVRGSQQIERIGWVAAVLDSLFRPYQAQSAWKQSESPSQAKTRLRAARST